MHHTWLPIAGLGLLLLVACSTASPDPATTPIGNDGGTGVEECVKPATTDQVCFSGGAEQMGVGRCKVGYRQCVGGSCLGEVLPAAETCETGEDEDCDGRAPPCPPAATSMRFGGTDEDTLTAISLDATGGLVLVGGTAGGIDFGGGALAMPGAFAAKLDASGKHVWSKEYRHVDLHAVAAPDGSTFLAGLADDITDLGGGHTVIGVFAAKLDPSGAVVWAKGFGGQGNLGVQIHVLALGADGSVAIGGVQRDTVNFGGAPITGSGMFVARLAGADGAHLTSRRIPSALDIVYPRINAIVVDAAGDLVMTGMVSSPADFGGGPKGGDTPSAGHVLIARYGPTGEHVHSAVLEGAAGVTQVGRTLAFRADGGVLVAGGFLGSITTPSGVLGNDGYFKPFFLNVDPLGVIASAQAYSGNFDADVAQLVPDGAGFVATGLFSASLQLDRNYSARDTDTWLARIDGAGSPSSSLRIGPKDRGTLYAVGVGKRPDGKLVVAGNFDTTADTGDQILTTAGKQDVFIATFSLP